MRTSNAVRSGTLVARLYLTSAYLILSACGDATQFYGGAAEQILSGADAEPRDDTTSSEPQIGPRSEISDTPVPESEPIELNFNRQLAWHLQCPTINLAPPALPAVDIDGPGPHQIAMPAGESTLELQFSALACPLEEVARDVIVIIDVSGSMGGTFGNDPLRQSSCGRLRAVRALLGQLQQTPEVRVGLVTFSDSAKIVGGGMLPADALLQSGDVSASNLCSANGGTDYTDALAQASTMLTTFGRTLAQREVFMISDGEPSQGRDGVDEAAKLKSPVSGGGHNAIIATLMLKGNDDALRRLASTDSNNSPLHRRANQAEQLTAVLSRLASPEVKSLTVTYRSRVDEILGQQFAIDLSALGNNPLIELPALKIDTAKMTGGLTIQLERLDNFGRIAVLQGDLLWFQAP